MNEDAEFGVVRWVKEKTKELYQMFKVQEVARNQTPMTSPRRRRHWSVSCDSDLDRKSRLDISEDPWILTEISLENERKKIEIRLENEREKMEDTLFHYSEELKKYQKHTRNMQVKLNKNDLKMESMSSDIAMLMRDRNKSLRQNQKTKRTVDEMVSWNADAGNMINNLKDSDETTKKDLKNIKTQLMELRRNIENVDKFHSTMKNMMKKFLSKKHQSQGCNEKRLEKTLCHLKDSLHHYKNDKEDIRERLQATDDLEIELQYFIDKFAQYFNSTEDKIDEMKHKLQELVNLKTTLGSESVNAELSLDEVQELDRDDVTQYASNEMKVEEMGKNFIDHSLGSESKVNTYVDTTIKDCLKKKDVANIKEELRDYLDVSIKDICREFGRIEDNLTTEFGASRHYCKRKFKNMKHNLQQDRHENTKILDKLTEKVDEDVETRMDTVLDKLTEKVGEDAETRMDTVLDKLTEKVGEDVETRMDTVLHKLTEKVDEDVETRMDTVVDKLTEKVDEDVETRMDTVLDKLTEKVDEDVETRMDTVLDKLTEKVDEDVETRMDTVLDKLTEKVGEDVETRMDTVLHKLTEKVGEDVETRMDTVLHKLTEKVGEDVETRMDTVLHKLTEKVGEDVETRMDTVLDKLTEKVGEDVETRMDTVLDKLTEKVDEDVETRMDTVLHKLTEKVGEDVETRMDTVLDKLTEKVGEDVETRMDTVLDKLTEKVDEDVETRMDTVVEDFQTNSNAFEDKLIQLVGTKLEEESKNRKYFFERETKATVEMINLELDTMKDLSMGDRERINGTEHRVDFIDLFLDNLVPRLTMIQMDVQNSTQQVEELKQNVLQEFQEYRMDAVRWQERIRKSVFSYVLTTNMLTFDLKKLNISVYDTHPCEYFNHSEAAYQPGVSGSYNLSVLICPRGYGRLEAYVVGEDGSSRFMGRTIIAEMSRGLTQNVILKRGCRYWVEVKQTRGDAQLEWCLFTGHLIA